MTRPELTAILSDLIRRNAISLPAARLTLARFGAGELTGLPLSTAELAQTDQNDNRWLLAVALLALMLQTSPDRRLNAVERHRAQRMLERQFATIASRSAVSVAAGGSIAEWEAGMQSAITAHARQMAVAGAGTLPRTAVQATVDEQIDGQWRYLAGFAVAMLVGRVIGDLMSEVAIFTRSILYGGVGTAAYWMGAEQQSKTGWVSKYISSDDGGTCGPCSEAERNGPYLIGQGPFPGIVCLGRGRCRCRRETVYDPVAYARLTGRRAA